MRQIVLDTETTGLETSEGHRIIEIGCVEIIERRLTGRHYHVYINPEREVDPGALEVHGISNDFLADKPKFDEVVEEFLEFVGSSELVIHNAAFDMGFINHELKLLNHHQHPLENTCSVLDTLKLAREKHPRQKNNLDALCKRYDIDNTHRELHGALLDAEILALVYLAMTGGQADMFAIDAVEQEIIKTIGQTGFQQIQDNVPTRIHQVPVVLANAEEQSAHQQFVDSIEKQTDKQSIFKVLETKE